MWTRTEMIMLSRKKNNNTISRSGKRVGIGTEFTAINNTHFIFARNEINVCIWRFYESGYESQKYESLISTRYENHMGYVLIFKWDIIPTKEISPFKFIFQQISKMFM